MTPQFVTQAPTGAQNLEFQLEGHARRVTGSGRQETNERDKNRYIIEASTPRSTRTTVGSLPETSTYYFTPHGPPFNQNCHKDRPPSTPIRSLIDGSPTICSPVGYCVRSFEQEPMRRVSSPMSCRRSGYWTPYLVRSPLLHWTFGAASAQLREGSPHLPKPHKRSPHGNVFIGFLRCGPFRLVINVSWCVVINDWLYLRIVINISERGCLSEALDNSCCAMAPRTW